jgi:hypothetical protein
MSLSFICCCVAILVACLPNFVPLSLIGTGWMSLEELFKEKVSAALGACSRSAGSRPDLVVCRWLWGCS